MRSPRVFLERALEQRRAEVLETATDWYDTPSAHHTARLRSTVEAWRGIQLELARCIVKEARAGVGSDAEVAQ